MPDKLKPLNFYRTKHSRVRRLWHFLISVGLFLLFVVVAALLVWHFWGRGLAA